MFKDTAIAHMMNRTIQLTGYDDDNFFDNVNAQPHDFRCQCGRPYRLQWFRDGVEAEFLDGFASK